jgi:hypothetical protein
VTGAVVGAGVGVVVGGDVGVVGCVGVEDGGVGLPDGTGLGLGVETAGAEISPVVAWRVAARSTTSGVTAGRLGCVRCRGGIRTIGGAGAGSITRGVAATRSSSGELDSKDARQR